MSTLQDVTGYESGAVLYGNEVMVLNWSSIEGLPRIFITGPIGLGEDLEAEAERVDEAGMERDEIERAVAAGRAECLRNGDDPSVIIAGAWRIKDALIVTFDGWA